MAGVFGTWCSFGCGVFDARGLWGFRVPWVFPGAAVQGRRWPGAGLAVVWWWRWSGVVLVAWRGAEVALSVHRRRSDGLSGVPGRVVRVSGF